MAIPEKGENESQHISFRTASASRCWNSSVLGSKVLRKKAVVSKLEFAAGKKDTAEDKNVRTTPRMARNNTKQKTLGGGAGRRTIVTMKGGRKGASFDRHRMKRMASEANARAHTVIVILNPTQKSCAISI